MIHATTDGQGTIRIFSSVQYLLSFVETLLLRRSQVQVNKTFEGLRVRIDKLATCAITADRSNRQEPRTLSRERRLQQIRGQWSVVTLCVQVCEHEQQLLTIRENEANLPIIEGNTYMTLTLSLTPPLKSTKEMVVS